MRNTNKGKGIRTTSRGTDKGRSESHVAAHITSWQTCFNRSINALRQVAPEFKDVVFHFEPPEKFGESHVLRLTHADTQASMEAAGIRCKLADGYRVGYRTQRPYKVLILKIVHAMRIRIGDFEAAFEAAKPTPVDPNWSDKVEAWHQEFDACRSALSRVDNRTSRLELKFVTPQPNSKVHLLDLTGERTRAALLAEDLPTLNGPLREPIGTEKPYLELFSRLCKIFSIPLHAFQAAYEAELLDEDWFGPEPTQQLPKRALPRQKNRHGYIPIPPTSRTRDQAQA